VAIKVMLEWTIKEHPERPEYPGAILDIWSWTETPLQKKVRLIEEGEAKRIEEEKEEWKEAEKIYEELLPKDYLWLRQRIEKLGLRDQVIHEITGFRAYKAPIRICYWCYRVHLRREMTYDPNLEWECSACKKFPHLVKTVADHDYDLKK